MKNKWSFQNGYVQLPLNKTSDFRAAIMAALKIKSTRQFRNRLMGEVEPKISDVEAIEHIFSKFGINQNIWGTVK
jgi:hypothetical protein